VIYALGERTPAILGANWYVADSATVIGSVVLHNNVSIWFNAVIRADNDVITIGENSNVQDGSILHVDPNFPLTLGRGVTIGHKVMLHGCTIGDNSLIGMNAVILNGAVIGSNCIVGAHALIAEGKEIVLEYRKPQVVATRTGSGSSRKSERNAPGGIPVARRNVRQRCASSAKPLSCARSDTVRDDSARPAAAERTRNRRSSSATPVRYHRLTHRAR
jgi:carbonic anhydrase/acetyltransferase-like protein (isoleucine patch superfamily)